MSSTGTPTPHLGLNQWLPNDKPERVDFDSDNLKIDAALKSMAHLTSADFTVLKRGGNTVWDAGNFVVESGTWTPKLEGATMAGEHAYKQQVGYYTRIGNLVTLRCYISITKDAAMDGAVRITGLPYSASHFTPASFSYVHYMGTNAATFTGFVEGSRINLGYQNITTGNYSNITSGLIGNAVLMCSVAYIKS